MSNRRKMKKKTKDVEPCIFCTLKAIGEQLMGLGEYLRKFAETPLIADEENKGMMKQMGADFINLSDVIDRANSVLTGIYLQETGNNPDCLH